MPKHQLWLAADQGELLELLDNWISVEYVRSYNQVNHFEIWLNGMPNQALSPENSSDASGPKVDRELLRPDRTVHIWRRPGGPEQVFGKANMLLDNRLKLPYALRLEQVGFLRSWDIRASNSLTITTALRGHDTNGLLDRRIVAYPAGEAETSKTGNADDVAKEIVAENLGSSATDTARDISALGFTIQADVSAAPSITQGFAWKRMINVLSEIADASRQLGTPLYFGIVPTSTTSFRFVTAVNQPGQDRTAGSFNPLIFGLKWGNMSNVVYNATHLNEWNYIYSLGTGHDDDRKVEEVLNQALIDASAFGRIEGTAGSQNGGDLTTAGNAKLDEKRPRISFSADIHDTPDLPYGGAGGWDLGDKVTVSFLGLQFDCVIETVHVREDRDGTETVRARVEYYP